MAILLGPDLRALRLVEGGSEARPASHAHGQQQQQQQRCSAVASSFPTPILSPWPRDGPNKGSAAAGAAGASRAGVPAARAAPLIPTPVQAAAPAPAPEMHIPMGHTPADAQKRIKQLLIMLTPDYASLSQLSSALLEDLRAHNLHDFLCSTLLHCIKCLPQKSLVFVGLLTALRIQLHKEGGSEAGGYKTAAAGATGSTGAPVKQGPDQFLNHFLGQLGDALLDACANGAWDELRLLVRFVLGLGLANLISMDAVWDVVERVHALLTEAGEGGADASMLLPTSQRDYLLHMLLGMVPFLAEAFEDPRFGQLQTKLQALVSTRAQLRRGRTSGRELLSVTVPKHANEADDDKMTDEEPAAASSSSSSGSSSVTTITDNFTFDLIDCWWASLSSLKSKDAYLHDASEVSLQRSSYQLFRVELDNLCKPLSFPCATLITLPAGSCPRLRPILRLFPRTPRVSASNMPLNDLLIGDYISDLLTIFEALHKEGTKQLLSLPLPLSDQARQNGQYLLIETLLENLLTLPTSNVRSLYYGTIFIDLFKAQPNLMPPLLGAAINALFHRLHVLDLELTERLLDWFSFHLSNFGYVWPWISWNYVLTQSETHPQRVFVTKALALCTRLSYWERIQQSIPEEFLVLMPPQPHPAFRFSAKNVEQALGDLNIQQYHMLSIDLCKFIQAKAQANVVIGWMDAQVTPVLGSEARLRLFTPCLLECGNKSYSHMIALLERYKGVFQVLCSNTTTKKKSLATGSSDAEEAPQLLSPFDCQRLIIHSLSEYWQHSAQHLVVLSEQLYIHGIVSAASIIAWVFFAQRHPERHTHLWKDVLFVMLRKALRELQEKVDAVLHKPRAMVATPERRAEDARTIEALLLERRELLVSCVANFQRLLTEVAKRDVSKERERARMEMDRTNIIQRFIHFARAFHSDLSACLQYLHEVVPKSSPLSDLVAQLPQLL